jgi:hypothetical protein
MTPKEYANQLFRRFYIELPQWVNNEDAKKCALIAVEEIIRICENEIISCSDKTFFYYLQVKTEIEKL